MTARERRLFPKLSFLRSCQSDCVTGLDLLESGLGPKKEAFQKVGRTFFFPPFFSAVLTAFPSRVFFFPPHCWLILRCPLSNYLTSQRVLGK